MIDFVNPYQTSYAKTIPYSTTTDATVYKLFSICNVNDDDPNDIPCFGSPNPIFTLTDTWNDC